VRTTHSARGGCGGESYFVLHTLTWSHNTFLHTLLPGGFDQPKSDCNMPLEACVRQRSQQRVLKKEPSVRCVPMKSHLCHTRPRTQHTLSQVALQPQQRINTNAARGDTHARWACVVDLPADFLNELTCACSGLDPAPTCDATAPHQRQWTATVPRPKTFSKRQNSNEFRPD
jgi:hypothetical protein